MDQPQIRIDDNKDLSWKYIPRMSTLNMLDDSEYIQLEGISDDGAADMSLRLSLLSGRSSRSRVSDASNLPENELQRSIEETVERNPCKRIGLHQVGIKFRQI